MDLGELSKSLGVRDEFVLGGEGYIEADASAASLVDEIFARHRNSTQPESQQLCIILSAVVEVIKKEGLQPTPTALFAAISSSLQRSDVSSTTEVTAAMCNLLAAVMLRVPTNVLRSRTVAVAKIMIQMLETRDTPASVSRAALPCLSQALAAMGQGDWPALSRGFAIILTACLDSQPKIRKKAQSGLVDILASLQLMPQLLQTASDAVTTLAQRVLTGPKAAAQAAAAAPSKKRQQAEQAITVAVADALHLLVALKQIIPLLSGSATHEVVGLVLALYPLHQPLLDRHATDTLAALCASSASHVTPRILSELLLAIMDMDFSWTKRDAESSLAMIRLLEEGSTRLAALDPAAMAAILSKVALTLLPLLASHHDGVRRAAVEGIQRVLSSGISEEQISAALAAAGPGRRKPLPIERVISAVESALGPQYQGVWEESLQIAEELIRQLGKVGAPLATGLLVRIGHLCAGSDDRAAAAQEELGDDDAAFRLQAAAQSTLGVALRAMGPEYVLEALPLHLQEGLAGTDEARTWMLPLLRMHVRGQRLTYWCDMLLPLARQMGSYAAAAKNDPKRQQETRVCSTLEAQIWATLPSFCSWAEDVDVAFPRMTKATSKAFEKRLDLRTPICNAVRCVAVQVRAASQSFGESIGHADPTSVQDDEQSGLENEKQDDADMDVPANISAESTAAAVMAIRVSAREWLPALLNAFVSTPANQRGHIGAAIAAYACLSEAATVAVIFRAAITKLMKVTQQATTGELGPDGVMEGGDSDTERRSTFLEAALLLAGGLDATAAGVLWKAAVAGANEKNPAVQKKSYKVMAYICESRQDFLVPHFQDVLTTLLETSMTAMSASRRYRLRCLKAVILSLLEQDGPTIDVSKLPATIGAQTPGSPTSRANQARFVIAPLITEIVLSVKEANKRSRTAAYDFLIDVARSMHQAYPPPYASDVPLPAERGGLHTVMTLVLGGLVGATPHMISASVMALARLLYEFAPVLTGLIPSLLPPVLLLLRSKAREVIKAVLGFVKVVAMRLPVAELVTFLPSICEGILLWAEDSKNKFRLKVRVIMERLARRCGFEALESAVPDSHRALLTHIRKQNNRRERRRADGASEMDLDLENDDDDEDAQSRKSRATRKTGMTKKSWDDGSFFEDVDDVERTRNGAPASIKATEMRRGHTASRSVKSAPTRIHGAHGQRLPSSDDPLDLLDGRTTRKIVQGVGGRKASTYEEEKDDDFERGKDGRMVIREETTLAQDGKRKRGEAEAAGFDSDDSDFEDLKGLSGLSLALRGTKSVGQAKSIAMSLGGKNLSKRSVRGDHHSEKGQPRGRAGQHTGDRFKSQKGGGDVKKGSASVEPYAYWPLDRKLLNRRASKARGARAGLDRIVTAAKEGAAKGRKAKRLKR